MMTGSNAKQRVRILKDIQEGTREARNGRLYSGIRTEWVVDGPDGEFIASRPTRREAVLYAKERGYEILD
jgi:hypothetical protein